MTITFKRFLNETWAGGKPEESVQIDDEADLLLILQKIAREAQPFLSQVGSKPLYRGFDISGPAVVKYPHPHGRQPLHGGDTTGRFRQDLCNYLAKEAFGIPDWRGDSIFTTGILTDTHLYGDPYVCVPTGEIEYLWSADVPDAVMIWRELGFTDVIGRNVADYARSVNYKWDPKNLPPETVAKMVAAFKRSYSQRDLSRAIDQGVEVCIIKSSGYWMIPLYHILQNADLNRWAAFTISNGASTKPLELNTPDMVTVGQQAILKTLKAFK